MSGLVSRCADAWLGLLAVLGFVFGSVIKVDCTCASQLGEGLGVSRALIRSDW